MTTLPTDKTTANEPYWKAYKPGHHWRSADDEFDAAKFGMWLFLATEILLFSGMFVAYFVLRMWYPEQFQGASEHYLDWRIGGLNTVILLISSFTVAMAVRNAQLGQQLQLRVNLLISILCGLAFLVIKLAFEYGPKIAAGEVPGGNFAYGGHAGDYLPSAYDPVFLSVYWVATAIHGFHVLVGAVLLTWVLWRAAKLHFGPNHYTAVENVGLYWHLVDLIWIFLFPLLYLVP
ncbi:MAG: cytochrome c oxidase subunit 3 family protein [Planctomycetota bacterium]|jgi:cytochrome c oxidase subunit 3